MSELCVFVKHDLKIRGIDHFEILGIDTFETVDVIIGELSRAHTNLIGGYEQVTADVGSVFGKIDGT